MPEPGLVMWILLAPLVLAVVDLFRTLPAIKEGRRSSPAPGAWSSSLHVKGT